MIYIIKNLLSCIVIILCISLTYGQSGVVSSGGSVINSTGSVSYSIGQVDYTYAESNTGSITAGIQQSFRISVINETDMYSDVAEIMLFPNPVKELVHINVVDKNTEKMSFRLYDLNGTLLKSENLPVKNNTINMHEFASGGYILEVTKNNKRVKTFKIIKK